MLEVAQDSAWALQILAVVKLAAEAAAAQKKEAQLPAPALASPFSHAWIFCEALELLDDAEGWADGLQDPAAPRAVGANSIPVSRPANSLGSASEETVLAARARAYHNSMQCGNRGSAKHFFDSFCRKDISMGATSL